MDWFSVDYEIKKILTDSKESSFIGNDILSPELCISNIKLFSLQLGYYTVTFSQIKTMVHSLVVGHIFTSRIALDCEIY